MQTDIIGTKRVQITITGVENGFVVHFAKFDRNGVQTTHKDNDIYVTQDQLEIHAIISDYLQTHKIDGDRGGAL